MGVCVCVCVEEWGWDGVCIMCVCVYCVCVFVCVYYVCGCAYALGVCVLCVCVLCVGGVLSICCGVCGVRVCMCVCLALMWREEDSLQKWALFLHHVGAE